MEFKGYKFFDGKYFIRGKRFKITGNQAVLLILVLMLLKFMVSCGTIADVVDTGGRLHQNIVDLKTLNIKAEGQKELLEQARVYDQLIKSKEKKLKKCLSKPPCKKKSQLKSEIGILERKYNYILRVVGLLK